MKQIVLSLFLYGIANCGAVDNSYLPPQNSQPPAGSQFFQPPVIIDARSSILDGQPILFELNGQKSLLSKIYHLTSSEQYPDVRSLLKALQANEIAGLKSQRNGAWFSRPQVPDPQQYNPGQDSLSRYNNQYSGGARFAQDFGLSAQYKENVDISSSTQYGVPHSLQDMRKQHGGSINIVDAVIPQRNIQSSWQVPYKAPSTWTVRNNDGGYKY